MSLNKMLKKASEAVLSDPLEAAAHTGAALPEAAALEAAAKPGLGSRFMAGARDLGSKAMGHGENMVNSGTKLVSGLSPKMKGALGLGALGVGALGMGAAGMGAANAMFGSRDKYSSFIDRWADDYFYKRADPGSFRIIPNTSGYPDLDTPEPAKPSTHPALATESPWEHEPKADSRGLGATHAGTKHPAPMAKFAPEPIPQMEIPYASGIQPELPGVGPAPAISAESLHSSPHVPQGIPPEDLPVAPRAGRMGQLGGHLDNFGSKLKGWGQAMGNRVGKMSTGGKIGVGAGLAGLAALGGAGLYEGGRYMLSGNDKYSSDGTFIDNLALKCAEKRAYGAGGGFGGLGGGSWRGGGMPGVNEYQAVNRYGARRMGAAGWAQPYLQGQMAGNVYNAIQPQFEDVGSGYNQQQADAARGEANHWEGESAPLRSKLTDLQSGKAKALEDLNKAKGAYDNRGFFGYIGAGLGLSPVTTDYAQKQLIADNWDENHKGEQTALQGQVGHYDELRAQENARRGQNENSAAQMNERQQTSKLQEQSRAQGAAAANAGKIGLNAPGVQTPSPFTPYHSPSLPAPTGRAAGVSPASAPLTPHTTPVKPMTVHGSARMTGDWMDIFAKKAARQLLLK